MIKDHPYHPKHCFCQVPLEDLKKWAIKRYKEDYSTLELLKQTNDPHEQEVICIVCLLDVDDKTLLNMMGDVNLPEHHILHCRDNVRAMVESFKK